MRTGKGKLVVLGIVAAVCVAVLALVLWQGLRGNVAQDAARIWRNTQEEGEALAGRLHG